MVTISPKTRNTKPVLRAFGDLGLQSPSLREPLRHVPFKAVQAVADFARIVKLTPLFDTSETISEACQFGKKWDAYLRKVPYHPESNSEDNHWNRMDNSIIAAAKKEDEKTKTNSKAIEWSLRVLREAVGTISYNIALDSATKLAGMNLGLNQGERIGESEQETEEVGNNRILRITIASGVDREARIKASLVFLNALGMPGFDVPWRPWDAIQNGGWKGLVNYYANNGSAPA
jgi:hypothetical protein